MPVNQSLSCMALNERVVDGLLPVHSTVGLKAFTCEALTQHMVDYCR